MNNNLFTIMEKQWKHLGMDALPSLMESSETSITKKDPTVMTCDLKAFTPEGMRLLTALRKQPQYVYVGQVRKEKNE